MKGGAVAKGLVHHHTLIVAEVHGPCKSEEEGAAFLGDLVQCIGMVRLYGPIVRNGPNGLSGFVIITTSHMSFHFYPDQRSLHMDVYSCRPYSLSLVMAEAHRFWCLGKADIVKIYRDAGLTVERFLFDDGQVRRVSSDQCSTLK